MLRQPVHNAPLMRDLSWEKRGGSIRGSTSLSSDGSQPESCSGCLDPRDGSTSSIASHGLAPRAKKETGRTCPILYPQQFKTILRICKRFCKRSSKRIEHRNRKMQPRNVSCSILSRCKNCRTGNFHINRLLTGSRLL